MHMREKTVKKGRDMIKRYGETAQGTVNIVIE
jgi:hypothetical protein